MKGTLWRFVTAPSSKCCSTAGKCVLGCTWPFAGIQVQCPKWFRCRPAPGYSSLLERFLGISTWLPHMSWIVTCHAPLIMGYLYLEVSSNLKWFCFLRELSLIGYSPCRFLCCQTNSHMQTTIFKQMISSCLSWSFENEFLENRRIL